MKTVIIRIIQISLISVTVFLTLQQNSNAQYKYNEKYGVGQYNYDVSGYTDNGYVYGNVDTNDRYVDGYITTEDGEQKYFYGEFTGYGEIAGTDEDGNYIQLNVD